MPLNEALGRVSEAVMATVPVPGFRASIMDGYALGQAHQPTVGDRWILKGRASAGQPFNDKLSAGECIQFSRAHPFRKALAGLLRTHRG